MYDAHVHDWNWWKRIYGGTQETDEDRSSPAEQERSDAYLAKWNSAVDYILDIPEDDLLGSLGEYRHSNRGQEPGERVGMLVGCDYSSLESRIMAMYLAGNYDLIVVDSISEIHGLTGRRPTLVYVDDYAEDLILVHGGTNDVNNSAQEGMKPCRDLVVSIISELTSRTISDSIKAIGPIELSGPELMMDDWKDYSTKLKNLPFSLHRFKHSDKCKPGKPRDIRSRWMPRRAGCRSSRF